jgi:hypothetical protein
LERFDLGLHFFGFLPCVLCFSVGVCGAEVGAGAPEVVASPRADDSMALEADAEEDVAEPDCAAEEAGADEVKPDCTPADEATDETEPD